MVEIIEDVDTFADLAPQWNELVRASSSGCPFLTAEWLQSWWRHLGGSRALHVIAVREGGRLMAAAPFLVAPGPLGIGTRLEFLGTGHAGSDYLDVIARIGHERDGLQAIASAIGHDPRALLLNHVTDSSLALQLAKELADVGWTSRRADVSVCPIVALAGHSWDSYLASLGASHRANFRRRLRALNSRFAVTFNLVTSDVERREALAAIVRFHAQRFGPGGSTAFLSPALLAFHDDATAQALERGWLRMYVLCLDGAPAGAMYGFSYNKRFYFYQHGFDSQYEALSVGLVLMGLTIQAALEEGALEFDMLYGTETYKKLWARDERKLVQIQLFPPRIAGFLYQGTADAERTMRAVARRLLSIGAARAS